MNNDINTILKDLCSVVKTAGWTLLSFYKKDYDIKDKGGDSPVTEADIKSNEIIISGLEKYGYGILSEETADDKSRLKKERVWIIDPMDGTKDFINKTGDFSIMVGLVEITEHFDTKQHKPILGVVYLPAHDTMYYATKGQGAFKKEKNNPVESISVSMTGRPEQIRIVSSRYHHSEEEARLSKEMGINERLTCGSSGYKICKIAEGSAELNFNPSDKTFEYDLCAADIILTEAGGKLTDIRGRRIRYNKDDPRNKYGYCASNRTVHGEVIKALAGGI